MASTTSEPENATLNSAPVAASFEEGVIASSEGVPATAVDAAPSPAELMARNITV
jgi:hypothetical protein